MILRVLSLIVAPALLWLLYHYYKDRLRPEPVVALGVSYVAGFAAGYLCLQAFEVLNRLGLRDDPTDAPGFLFLFGLVSMIALCTSQCRAAWPLGSISIWSNLVIGIPAALLAWRSTRDTV